MIAQKLKKVMSQVLKVPEESINENSSPDTISSWDSVVHMKLVLAMEQKFGISFSEEEIMEMLSFEIILEILKEKAN